MSSEKTIYDLSLNETLTISLEGSDRTDVTRVPGGWIYEVGHCTMALPNSCGAESVSVSTSFVPYNEEFKK